jgi:hypothetical protein
LCLSMLLFTNVLPYSIKNTFQPQYNAKKESGYICVLAALYMCVSGHICVLVVFFLCVLVASILPPFL